MSMSNVRFGTVTIPGWFAFQGFYDRAVAAAPPDSLLVEVGCWLGASTAYLGLTCKLADKGLRILAVDTWRGSPDEAVHQDYIARHGDIYQQFLDNMRSLDLLDIITPQRLPSVEAAAQLAPGSAAMVFIDAAHDHASVCADIRAWKDRVMPGGWLCGHDYHTCPDVRRAVHDCLGRPDEHDHEQNTWLKVIQR